MTACMYALTLTLTHEWAWACIMGMGMYVRMCAARMHGRLPSGNFQDRERMRMEKKVRLRYGRFFYRFPDGESAADVYDRVTGRTRLQRRLDGVLA